MTREITTAQMDSPLFEIREKPEDTPHSVIASRRAPTKAVWALAATTQILNPSYSALNDYASLIAKDITGLREEEHPHDGILVFDEEMPANKSPGMSDAEIANRDRLELLARAYVAGQLSNEEQARLTIVTERVRRLIPRVTVADFERLEQIAGDVERIGSEDAERRRLLGIT